jgi:ribulose-phosphate 3-epimerase
MSVKNKLENLKRGAPLVLPSLLLCDFGNLEKEVRQLEAAGFSGLHLDVMDGVFVPNMTYGMPIVKGLRGLTDLPLDVHLMIANPGQYIQSFVDAGSDLISIHAESVDDPIPVLKQIRDAGCGVGIAINPDTPVEKIADCLPLCDLAVIMSVQAGFGGQKFDPGSLDKLRLARELGGPDLMLEIDGGVNVDTIGQCVAAGAELLVAGSAIFRQPDYGVAMENLLAQVNCTN